MFLVITLLLWAAAIPVTVACIVLFCECLIAWALPPLRSGCPEGARPPIAVLIPAHNESLVITQTIEIIREQLHCRDRLVVVADNCSDDTAHLSRRGGAEVIERNDPDRRGKGYALAFGIEYLAQQPPEVLVLIDADTHPQNGALDGVAHLAATTGQPAQAIYTLDPPVDPRPRDLVSWLAFTIRGSVRPLGLARLGFPVPITGTGIALPWTVARTAPLNTGNIVEDMQLGIDLALRGSPALLCPEARVTGRLPGGERAARVQRTRWEHGHLQTLLLQAPRLLLAALSSGRLDLLVVALDLAVPPLSLLCLAWCWTFCHAVLAAWFGISTAPVFVLAVSGLLFCSSVFIGWFQYCRELLPFRSLLAVPLYVFWKIPLYATFFFRPQREWLRTERERPTT